MFNPSAARSRWGFDMNRYDPLVAPKPRRWLSLDEQEAQMMRCHKAAGLRMPNGHLHASMHVIVENQLAMRIPQVTSALNRMLAQGLDRHEAIHAVASVLSNHIYEALRNPEAGTDLNQAYLRDLEGLIAEKWLSLEELPPPISRKAARLRHRLPWK
jgi:Domain of unknown function (DUF1841)